MLLIAKERLQTSLGAVIAQGAEFEENVLRNFCTSDAEFWQLSQKCERLM